MGGARTAGASATESGFNSGLNWYRDIDRNWDPTAPLPNFVEDL